MARFILPREAKKIIKLGEYDKGNLKKLIIKKFSLSTWVVLKNIKTDTAYYLIMDNKKQEGLISAIDYYRKGFIQNHEMKFKNFFMTYEFLTRKSDRDIYFSAIRDSMSHPILKNKKEKDALSKLFGTTRINLDTYKHKKIFNKEYSRLKEVVEDLLGQYLWKRAQHPKTRIGFFRLI